MNKFFVLLRCSGLVAFATALLWGCDSGTPGGSDAHSRVVDFACLDEFEACLDTGKELDECAGALQTCLGGDDVDSDGAVDADGDVDVDVSSSCQSNVQSNGLQISCDGEIGDVRCQCAQDGVVEAEFVQDDCSVSINDDTSCADFEG